MVQITVKQLAAAKRTAMNVLPLTNKKEKLQAKIAEMEKEIESLNQQIDVQQGYVKSFAGGLTTEQLLVRNENKAFVHNPEVLYFDEEKRVYIVKEDGNNNDAAPAAEMPNEEEAAAAEQARLEAEAEEQERIAEEEAAKMKAEEEAKEAARQAEIAAAKERLTASKPAATEEHNDDPFA